MRSPDSSPKGSARARLSAAACCWWSRHEPETLPRLLPPYPRNRPVVHTLPSTAARPLAAGVRAHPAVVESVADQRTGLVGVASARNRTGTIRHPPGSIQLGKRAARGCAARDGAHGAALLAARVETVGMPESDAGGGSRFRAGLPAD